MITEHIADPLVVSCPDPVNLIPSDRFLFARGKTMRLHDRSIETHSDVHVYGRGPLWSDGEYLVESFVMASELEEMRRRRKHWRDGIERLFQPTRRFDPTALWVTDQWSFGYFHWTCDALPRLEFAAEHRSLADLTLLLPAKMRRCPFIIETLKPYGLKEIRVLGRFEHLKCRQLLVPTHIAPTGSYDPKIMNRLRNRFVQHCWFRDRKTAGDRLYISRQLAARRRIENEAELLPILKSFGFRILHAEKVPWKRQIRLASSARILVGNHGAGLTNMIAMSPGSRVLEVRDHLNEQLYCYYTLAAAMGLDYYYVLADRADPRAKPNRSNMMVDAAEFRSVIERMIEDQASQATAVCAARHV